MIRYTIHLLGGCLSEKVKRDPRMAGRAVRHEDLTLNEGERDGRSIG